MPAGNAVAVRGVVKLLLVCEYATLNGGEQSMLATLRPVQAAGFEVAAAAPPEGMLAEALQQCGVEVLPLAFHDVSGARRPQSVAREQLAGCIRAFHPRLIHANSLAMGRMVGPVAAEMHVASAAHLRDIVKLSRRAVSDLNAHSRLLAVSAATRAFHVEQGLDPGKTFVLHNGVDLDAFRPGDPSGYLHRELGLPPGAMLAGTIGQICLRKGHDLLAQAAVALADRLPRLHYVVVGARWSEKDESRRFESALRETAAGPLGGRMHFLGFRRDVPRLLRELTLLVHPARQEPLGRVLLEAAACGVPIVATGVGGTREIFPEACEAARIVPPRREALAEAIGDVVERFHYRQQLAAASRRRAEEAFDKNDAAKRLIGHYREIAAADWGRDDQTL